MLFKGSEKYPDETLFTSVVQGNGGRFNAYTGFIKLEYLAKQDTNYYF
jgi:secreted Zn-dependent insulinase-like peptidase